MSELPTFHEMMSGFARRKAAADLRNHTIFSVYLHAGIVTAFLCAVSLLRILGLANTVSPTGGYVLLMYGAALFLGLTVALLRSRVERQKPADLARLLDRRLRLQDRLLTAVELSQGERSHPFEDAVYRDAVGNAQFALNRIEGPLFRVRGIVQPPLQWIVIGLLIWAFPVGIMQTVRGLWDRVPPRILATAPGAGADNIRVDRPLTLLIEFSEEMRPADISPATLFVRSADRLEPLSARIDLVANNRIARVTLNEPLRKDGLYGLYVSWRMRDMAGNYLHAFTGPAMDEYFVASFRSEATRRLEHPMIVTAISPVHGAEKVALDARPQLDFSLPVSIREVDGEHFILREKESGAVVDCLVSRSSTSYNVILEPWQRLKPDTVYQVETRPGVMSRTGSPLLLDRNAVPDGNVLENGDYIYAFRTTDQQGGAGEGADGLAGDGVTPLKPDKGDSTLPESPDGSGNSGGFNSNPDPFVEPGRKPNDLSDRDDIEKSSLPGDGTDDNLFTDPTDPQFNPIDVAVDPMLDEDALFNERMEKFKYEEKEKQKSDADSTPSPDAPATYEAMFQKYEREVLDKLDAATIPPVYRDLVKSYFKRMRPADGK